MTCPRSAILGGLAAAMLLPARPAPTLAQAEAVGRIERMLMLVPPADETEHTCGPTDQVEVLRAGTPDPQQGRCDLPILLEDRIRVRPRTVVRLLIRSPAGDGNLALSADSLFTEIGGDEEAFYEIRETPQRLTGWELAVTRGSLALHWLRGQLSLFNSGTRAVVSGTRLVLTQIPGEDRGTLHLIEGSVTFPDYPDVTLLPGEWARLTPGAAPEVTAVAQPVAERFRQTADWSVDQVWERPFYQNPWLYVGVAAAGAVAAWALWPDSDGRHRDTVILRLPW